MNVFFIVLSRIIILFVINTIYRKFKIYILIFSNNATNSSSPEQVEKVIKVKLMTSQNERSHGSLFLRFGVLAFGLGTLIYVGLEFLSFFEVPRTCMKWAILLGANPVIYMIFVFMQMYYIFVHSRINVNKNKVSLIFYVILLSKSKVPKFCFIIIKQWIFNSK